MGEAKRIGLIGGTFDPIHIGHLTAAEWARAEFQLEQVIFVPAGDPPHKSTELVSSSHHRYTMTLLATLTNPWVSVSRIEIERSGKSFTYDTLKALSDQISAEDELFFIMGADSLADLPQWHRPEDIIELSPLIVVTRPDWDYDRVAEELGPFYLEHAKRIHRLVMPDIGVSSEMIRERVRLGASIRYLTPDLVARYIEEHGLYLS